MREFAKFVTGFWTSDSIQKLSDTGKLLAAYLITSPHSNQAGTFRMPVGYIQGDLRWPEQRVIEGFVELSAKGFASRCDATEWIVIHKALKHTPPENPNQGKHVRMLLEQVPRSASIRNVIAQCLNDYWPKAPNDLIEAFGKALPKPLGQQREGEGEGEGEGEKKEKESTTRKRVSRASRSSTKKPVTAVPADFKISPAVRDWAKGEGFEPYLEAHLAHFIDYAKAGRDGVEPKYVDWDAAFRNCIRADWGGVRHQMQRSGHRPADFTKSVTSVKCEYRDSNAGDVCGLPNAEPFDRYGGKAVCGHHRQQILEATSSHEIPSDVREALGRLKRPVT